jgi:hypothetical protein
MTASWTDADYGLLNEVYQFQCISRMNEIYYGRRLKEVQRLSFAMELVIAGTASGSGLASLSAASVWGQSIWQLLLYVAAAVAIVRPIYAPGKKIELLTRQQHGYLSNYFALKKLAFAIRQNNGISNEIRRRFDTIFDRHVQISADDETPSRRHLKQARLQAEIDLPSSGFWWPKPKTETEVSSVPESAETERNVSRAQAPVSVDKSGEGSSKKETQGARRSRSAYPTLLRE